MRRFPISALVLLAGCGLASQPTVEAPAPVTIPGDAAPATAAPVSPGGVTAASGPGLTHDTLQAARDSALDAAVLEQLEDGLPAAAAYGALPPLEDEAAALRALFDIDVVNFADHARVKYYIDFFTGPARERMAIWLGRMPKWEPLIRAQLISKGLPGDLAYLPLIESGYSNTVVSRSKAVGMWQFMRGTGKWYGLKIDRWVDERREPFRATSTAIRYLSDLTTKFGSPYLAAAAYNGGPGRVQRGLARLDIALTDEEAEETVEDPGAEAEAPAGPAGGDAAFFTLAGSRYIHRETKDYVPKLIAAAMIAKRPERYGFTGLPSVEVLLVDSVTVPDATGLDVIARAAGTDLSTMRELNPHLLRTITPPGRKSVVLVPDGAGVEAQRTLDALPAAKRVAAIAHKVRSGETLSRIAKRYGMTVADIKAFNPSVASRVLRAGETLRIPGHARVKSLAAADARVARVTSATTHRVQRGQTLSGIAKRYRVSVKQLQSWNGLGSKTQIRAGQRLRVRPRATPSANTRVAR
jgi:membrane-bound lytic murein transglycosylase D